MIFSDLPGRVSDVEVTMVDRSAVVSWTVPDQLVYENRKITEYVVTLTPKKGEALTLAIEKPFSVGPDGRLSGSLKDVEPGEYGVAIHAEDDEGRKSEEIQKSVHIRGNCIYSVLKVIGKLSLSLSIRFRRGYN